MSLKSELNSYVASRKAQAVTLGEQKDSRDMLVLKLEKTIKKTELVFWFCAGMGVLLFLGSIIAIYYFISTNRMEELRILFASTGVSLSGVIWYMHRLWKEKVSTELIVVLSSNMEQQHLEKLFEKLLEKL